MTRNGDQLDRLLDAWLDDGPVVLPDRALANVFEVVGRTRQRSATPFHWRYLPMITSPTRRLGLPLATIGVLAILVATAGALALLRPVLDGPRLGAPSEAVLSVDDVRAAVLGRDDAPAETTLQSFSTVNLRYLMPDAAVRNEWAALGLTSSDTWHSYFTGPGGDWVTAGMVWPDVASAREALAAHQGALPTILQGEEELAVTGLGDEGSCYSFVNNAIMNGQGAACLFRVDNATFFIPGSGPSIEASDVVSVARSVADRTP